MIEKPTPEDFARDAEADMSVCNAATPEPWYDLDSSSEMGEHHDACWMVISPYPDDVVDAIAFSEHSVDEIPDSHANTFKFIALARTALPAWIRRAVAAEAKQLSNKHLQLLEKAVNEADTISPCACCGQKLAWIWAGDGTVCWEVYTGKPHNCTVTADDFQQRRFPLGTYRHVENRAIIAETRIGELEAAIRHHRDERGDDRCHADDGRLYAVLPEGDTRPERETAVTIENCQRYIECRQTGREYVSPQRRIEELEAEVAALRNWIEEQRNERDDRE